MRQARERSWWGWGWADQALDGDGLGRLAERIRPFLPLDGQVAPIPAVGDLDLPAPRIAAPDPLAPITSAGRIERVAHARGKAYRDVVRNLAGELPNPPDLVARPRTERDIADLLDWAADREVAVVPYGGGTSVVGGVEYRGPLPWVSLDLGRLSGVDEVDALSLVARIGAGTLGPAVEDALRPYGLTLRHYPQSFEFSTVGGWVATRAGGHFATGATHIDDLVQATRAVTGAGIVESLAVPASGAGPSPDRLWLGSEGILGVLTSARLRVRRRPRFRSAAALRFAVFDHAVDAVRTVVQAGLGPANCRLLDPLEGMLSAGVTDGSSRLLLGFESADLPQDAVLAAAREICAAHRGTPEDTDPPAGSARRWREAFLRAPYLRDGLIRLGVLVETFETACTWTRFADLHAAVTGAVTGAGAAAVACRFTHVYPDGPAPYFTVYAPARRGAEVATWDGIKAAAAGAIAAHGGTITHHHAVGRDHRPWYDRQRPDGYAAALAAAKRVLDPAGVLNPGVLIG